MASSDLIQLVKGHPLKLSCLALFIMSPPVLRMLHYFTPLLASTALCVLALITIGQNRNAKAAAETDLDDQTTTAVSLLSNSIDTSMWSTEVTKEDKEEQNVEEREDREEEEEVVEEEALKSSPRRSSERLTTDPAKEMKDDGIGSMNGNDDITCDGDKMNVNKAMRNVEGLSTYSSSSKILSCVEQAESTDNASSVKELLQEGIHNSDPRESHGCLRDYPHEEANMPLAQSA